MNIFRAYRAGDTALIAWVRDDAGKVVMTEQAVTVDAYRNGNLLKTFEATSPEAGRVDFTVTSEQADDLVRHSPLILMMKADDAVVRIGVLEVV